MHATASWTRKGTPDDALSALVAYGKTSNARVDLDGSRVTLAFGSRLAYRIMGLTTWRVPYIVRVSVAAASAGPATSLTAEASSNEGWYAFRTESATLNYARRIAATLDELQEL